METKKQFERQGISEVKVVSLKKLRTKYKPFDMRRQLVARYEVFLCDVRIKDKMLQVLGKTFVQRKKLPVPLKVRREREREREADRDRGMRG